MIVKLLTELHLGFLSLKGGCRGSSESTLVKMLRCWKSHATVYILIIYISGGPSGSNCVVIDYGEWWDDDCANDDNKYICECVSKLNFVHIYTGKCIRRFGGIYAYCWYLIDWKW